MIRREFLRLLGALPFAGLFKRRSKPQERTRIDTSKIGCLRPDVDIPGPDVVIIQRPLVEQIGDFVSQCRPRGGSLILSKLAAKEVFQSLNLPDPKLPESGEEFIGVLFGLKVFCKAHPFFDEVRKTKTWVYRPWSHGDRVRILNDERAIKRIADIA